MSSKITEILKEFTYLECFECCSVHEMRYSMGTYMCEECYREVEHENAQKEDILVKWRELKEFLLRYKNDKILQYEIISEFFTKILKSDVDVEVLKVEQNKLNSSNEFMEHLHHVTDLKKLVDKLNNHF